MKNIKWKYLGEAILFAIQLVTVIAISLALLCGPIILKLNFNFNYFWVIYIFYGFVFIAITAYKDLVRGEYLGEAITEYQVYKLASKYEDARIIDKRTEFSYKTKIYYNKETNTITLT